MLIVIAPLFAACECAEDRGNRWRQQGYMERWPERDGDKTEWDTTSLTSSTERRRRTFFVTGVRIAMYLRVCFKCSCTEPRGRVGHRSINQRRACSN